MSTASAAGDGRTRIVGWRSLPGDADYDAAEHLSATDPISSRVRAGHTGISYRHLPAVPGPVPIGRVITIFAPVARHASQLDASSLSVVQSNVTISSRTVNDVSVADAGEKRQPCRN